MVYNEQPQERIAQYTGWFTEITIDNKRIYCLQEYFFWTTLYYVILSIMLDNVYTEDFAKLKLIAR